MSKRASQPGTSIPTIAAPPPTAVPRSNSSLTSRRSPAAPIAVCIACGILFDSVANWQSLSWLLLAWTSLATFVLFRSRFKRKIALMALFVFALSLGGLRHHVFYSNSLDDDLSLFAHDTQQPVHLTGQIVSEPEYRNPQSKSPISFSGYQSKQTQCLLTCTEMISGSAHIPTSGLAQVSISGHLVDLKKGDVVTLWGSLRRPNGPKNPGEFDWQTYLKRQQIRSSIYVSHPEAVMIVSPSSSSSISQPLGQLRSRFQTLISSHIDQESNAMASALLLGDRSRLSPETENQFIQTGSMHLLAISGLHVGILAAFLFVTCRVVFSQWILGQFIPPYANRFATWITPVVTTLGVITYAGLIMGRPSTIRATILICLGTFVYHAQRKFAFFNTLALAAIGLLLWKPSDLFDTGAQLSFMAVAVIGVITNVNLSVWRKPSLALPRERSRTSIFFHHWLNRFFKFACVSIAIWIVVAPLVAGTFHVVSPIGLLGNLILIPIMFAVLWSGYLFLLLGTLSTSLASLMGNIFNSCLDMLQNLVSYGNQLPGSFLYLPGPSHAWLYGFYGLLAGLVFIARQKSDRKTWALMLMLWITGGLSLALLPRADQKLKCTFLAMGHGCSVIVELPNGRTLLYDAGSLSGEVRAERTVSHALWDKGIDDLDAIVLSHADIDHFNGVAGLLSKLPVTQLIAGRPFFRSQQASAAWLGEVAYDKKVPISIVGTDDEIGLDRDVTLRVLHPDLKTTDAFSNDNAGSVVLLIEYAGRRILLTGDLEMEGLTQLVQHSPLDVDVMLSPHHGSLAANPPDLPRWSRPEWLVISSNSSTPAERLRAIYGPETGLLTTAEFGAITFEIEPNGRLSLASFLTDGE